MLVTQTRKAAVIFLLMMLMGGGGFFLGQSAKAAGTEPGSEADPLVARSYVDQYVGLRVVSVPAGQRLTAGVGTEIIIRDGKAAAVAGTGGGLSDLTAAKDLKAGEVLALNHLLLVPREDGRGFAAVSDVTALVRGQYEVLPE
ncbi:MAG: hypothetical protein ACOX8W_00165 [bacterium]